MVRSRNIWILALFTSLTGCDSGTLKGIGSESAKEKEDPEDTRHLGEADGSGTGQAAPGADEPEWVNSYYLSCAWSGAQTTTSVRVLCGLNDDLGHSIPPDQNVTVQWSVLDQAGATIKADMINVSTTTATQQLFILPSRDVANTTITTLAGTHPPADTGLAGLDQKLVGLAPGAPLRACLEQGAEAAGACLSAASTPLVTISATLPSARIFVTSSTYTGGLGGIAGADATCQHVASVAGLAGHFIAFLSGTALDASARVAANQAFVDVAGHTLGENIGDLLTGSLPYALNVDEIGRTVAPSNVFTGSSGQGKATGQDCQNWTGTGASGTIGLIGDRDTDWISNSNVACDSMGHLYCVEGPVATP